MPFTVVYAGTPEFAVPALEALAAASHSICAVLTQPDRPAGRGRGLAPGAVKLAAARLGLAVLQPASLKDAASLEALRALAPDVLVVAAYGLLLPAPVLAVPRVACINLHASLLPRWRGAAPVQRAILAGDTETGVAIMKMQAGLDTGPVYAEKRVPIAADDTGTSLTRRLATEGAELLVATLAAIEAGSARATPQPAAGVSYARKLEKSEAPLDWSRPAIELERQVRAFVPWPVATASWQGVPLRIHTAAAIAGERATPGRVVAVGAAGIEIATGAGRLRLEKVQLAGRGIVSAVEFARGVAAPGLAPGSCFDGAA